MYTPDEDETEAEDSRDNADESRPLRDEQPQTFANPGGAKIQSSPAPIIINK